MKEPEVKMKVLKHFQQKGYLVEEEYYIDNKNRIDFRVDSIKNIEMFIECKGDIFCNHDLIEQLNRYKSVVDNLYLAIPKKNIDRWESFILYTKMDIGLICVKESGCDIIIERENNINAWIPTTMDNMRPDLISVFKIYDKYRKTVSLKDIIKIYKDIFDVSYIDYQKDLEQELISLVNSNEIERMWNHEEKCYYYQ